MQNGAAAIQQNNIKSNPEEALLTHYSQIRQQSESLCEPLETEDYGIQIKPEVSPPKWHLAHTAWFFETFLLKPYLKGYEEYHPLYNTLFNSYYDTIGRYHPRLERGLLSRPTVVEIIHYRAYVDKHMKSLLSETDHGDRSEVISRTILGLNHEQQHQELLLTDIKANFAYNPLRPVYRKSPQPEPVKKEPFQWLEFKGGVTSIGHKGYGFSYDNEEPRHHVYLNDFRLASRPANNSEYMEFIEAGAYQQPELWLSDAWKLIQEHHWQAPLYWEQVDGKWCYMTLSGMQYIDEHAPVCHISHYEAAAYARWAGKRLPSEAEWEVAATDLPVTGNLYESGLLQPTSAQQNKSIPGLQQMFGDVWEWTQSAYSSYPGYQQARGPLGEYNGKFMSSQIVLRGGSCVTPANHIRASYRNFFFPHERWQFSGLRLAEDIR